MEMRNDWKEKQNTIWLSHSVIRERRMPWRRRRRRLKKDKEEIEDDGGQRRKVEEEYLRRGKAVTERWWRK